MANLKDPMTPINQNKRKRDSQDMPGGRAAPNMTAGNHNFDQEYLQGPDDGMDNTTHMLELAEAWTQQQQQQHQQQNAQEHGDNGDHHHQDAAHMQPHGQNHPQPSNGGGAQDPSDTAAAAMAQYHTMTVPQSTESAFMSRTDDEKLGDLTGSNNFRLSGGGFDMEAMQKISDEARRVRDLRGEHSPIDRDNAFEDSPRNKPTVGSEEWNKLRRDNHKEVERRRRETINEGINELAKIVPGCEKNKGSILARAVQFITQLKENETQNIEKWTLEKLLTEQAIAELSASCDKLKGECQRAWKEVERWKREAGVEVGEGEGRDGGEGSGGEGQ